MVLKYTNKTIFILLDGFARVYIVSANFPDNPRISLFRLTKFQNYYKWPACSKSSTSLVQNISFIFENSFMNVTKISRSCSVIGNTCIEQSSLSIVVGLRRQCICLILCSEGLVFVYKVCRKNALMSFRIRFGMIRLKWALPRLQWFNFYYHNLPLFNLNLYVYNPHQSDLFTLVLSVTKEIY